MGKSESLKRIDVSKYIRAYSGGNPVLVRSGGSASVSSGVTTDHGTLTGLGDDDHPQYPARTGTENISGTWTFASGSVRVGSGSDKDNDLITVSVTDAPKMTWDESEDSFTLTKGLDVTGSVDATTVTGANVTSGSDPGHTHTHSSVSSVPGHDHTGDAGDGGQITVGALSSIGADTGYAPLADGMGGVAWGAVATELGDNDVCHVGTSAPTNLYIGRLWLDTTP
jgi:hypothetical protein